MLIRAVKVLLAVFLFIRLSSSFSGTTITSDQMISIWENPGFQHLIANLQAVVNEEAKEEKIIFCREIPCHTQTYLYVVA